MKPWGFPAPGHFFIEVGLMKKLNSLSESDFLKRFFAVFSAAFFIGAICMPDRASMFSGFLQILSQPCKVSTNYFAVGGFAATFLNMGLVALMCTGLFFCLHATANNVSTLAVILTTGFGTWGINPLNILPTMAGVCLYCLIKKEKLAANVNAMMFSTGIAPLITDLMVRYPNAEPVGFNLPGVLLAIAVGLCIGVFLPAGLAHSPKVHKGFDLYSAAFPIGMTAFFLQATLFKTMGIAVPAAPSADGLAIASPMIVNTFCIILFGSAVVVAFLMGCKPKDYYNLLIDPELVNNFTSTYNNSVFLMNFGIFGLFILGYYNLIGASFNGVTFGIIFCMLATCNSGSHPNNVWPIMAGYYVASLAFGWLSSLVGGSFSGAINAQAIVIGLCYANGLSPIADKYGWRYGFLAAVMHYLLVTSVPTLHGGFCLYNGGFTAALICIILVPNLERLSKDKFERKAFRSVR